MRCKARNRKGVQCSNQAVTGYRVCRMHGCNKSNPGGAPRGNKQALKTGMYEDLSDKNLTEKEKAFLYDSEIVYSDQVLRSYKLLCIRELRMLGRLLALRGQINEGYSSELDFIVVEKTKRTGANGKFDIDLRETKEVLVLEKIQAIEDCLNGLQREKTKMLDHLRTVSGTNEQVNNPLDELREQINRDRQHFLKESENKSQA